jgi:hypothetical protein
MMSTQGISVYNKSINRHRLKLYMSMGQLLYLYASEWYLFDNNLTF